MYKYWLFKDLETASGWDTLQGQARAVSGYALQSQSPWEALLKRTSRHIRKGGADPWAARGGTGEKPLR